MRSRAAWSAGWPRISIVPASGPRMFITIRSVVVLPAPFGPSRPKTLWRGPPSERSSTATWPAKAFRMPLSTRALSFNGASWLSRFPYEKAAGGVPPRDGRVTWGPRRAGGLVCAGLVVRSSRFGKGVPARVLALHLVQVAALLCVVFAFLGPGLSLPRDPRAWLSVAAIAVVSPVVSVIAFLAGMGASGRSRGA